MLSYYEWVLLLIFIALVSFLVSLVYYRKTGIAFWGYIGALLPDVPKIILVILGATNLQLVNLASHTIGLLLWPVILVIADVFLIELAFLKVAKPFRRLLPGNLKAALRIERIAETLQGYHAIPRPERVKAVYFAGLAGGIINLFIMAVAGAL